MRLYFYLLILFLCYCCNNANNTKHRLIDFIPPSASVSIKTSNLDDLKSSLQNNDFIQRLSKTSTYNNLSLELESLALLNTDSDVLICFSQINDSLQHTIITNYNDNILPKAVIEKVKAESMVSKNNTIAEFRINNQLLYGRIIDSIFFASSYKPIVKSAVNTPSINTDFAKMYHTASSNKTLSIFIKADTPFIKSFFPNLETLKLDAFTDFMAIDADISQEAILFNGITKASDSAKSLVNIFKGNTPQTNQIQALAPFNCDGFLSFTFNNFNTLKQQLSKFNTTDSTSNNSTLFNNTNEVGVIYQGKNRAIVLNALDNIAVKDALVSEQTLIDTFRNIAINSFSTPQLFSDVFFPLISFKEANSYCILDEYFVFSNNIEMLQNIITNYQNKTTLNTTESFQNITEHLSNASSILLISNPLSLKNSIDFNLNDSITSNFKEYKVSGLQFVYDSNFAHVNGIIKKHKTKATKNGISEAFNIKLNADILKTPQFVINHITKEHEIVVQDINNNVYLISSKGKILWKKQLSESILGPVNQMDIYKNGKLQLVFATAHNLYVIDRNGNDVAPFPKTFKDAITEPLALFDYDNNKNYRLVITQGKNVLMYNAKGNLVKGFTFKATESPIITKPEHFRLSNKDYLIFKTKNKLYILDRRGKTRVKPQQNYNYSTQPVFAYKGHFTTTTAKGDLINIDTKGKIASRNLNLPENHGITTSNKTLVVLNDNTLLINDKTATLDYGNYSSPKLFLLNNKLYITVTDLQAQKIYIFDSQARLLPNFPVYGTSEIDLSYAKNTLKFVVKGENNTVITYQIN